MGYCWIEDGLRIDEFEGLRRACREWLRPDTDNTRLAAVQQRDSMMRA